MPGRGILATQLRLDPWAVVGAGAGRQVGDPCGCRGAGGADQAGEVVRMCKRTRSENPYSYKIIGLLFNILVIVIINFL